MRLQHHQGCSGTPKCAYVIYGQPLTLDGWPKNKRVRASFIKFGIFEKRYLKTKSPGRAPLGRFKAIWMVLGDKYEWSWEIFAKKTKFHDAGGPGTVVSPTEYLK